MDQPPDEQRQVPAYVALVRIAAVIGMSTAAAFGLFIMLIGSMAAILLGLAFMALAVPCFVVMRLVERTVESRDTPPR